MKKTLMTLAIAMLTIYTAMAQMITPQPSPKAISIQRVGITDITIDGTLLSTSDNVIEGFSFYPNPTNGTLNLDSVESIEDVAIYNLLGQQVLAQSVDATSTQLDTSSLATGAYLMKVTVNGQTGTYKVIKR